MTPADQIYSMPTDVGVAKLAYAIATNQTVQITEMAIGDGGGALVSPGADADALVREVYRAPLNQLYQHEMNPNWLVAELVIPAEVGGWTIRELMLYDVDGDPIFVGNHAEQYKPIQSQGSDETKTIRMVILVSSTSAVTLKTDPSVVLATRKYADDGDAKRVSTAGDSMSGPLRANAGVRAKKGLPANDASNLGYSFEDDGDTGLFADIGDTEVTGSDLVLMVDGSEAARFGVAGSVIPNVSLSGEPSTPTAPPGTNSQRLANTAFVQAAIAALVDSSPAALNTLNELATALGDDPNFATTVTNAIAGKQASSVNLTALAALVGAANQLPYFTAEGAMALTAFTAFTRTLLAAADAASAQATLGGFGYGQTYQDLTASRVPGTTYTNTTGRPIQVAVSVYATNNPETLTITVGGITIYSGDPGSAGAILMHTFIVPPGATYSVTITASAVLNRWVEFR